MGSVAVITIAHGRHEHLLRQQRSLARGSRTPDHWVVVAMGDPDLAAVTAGGDVLPHLVQIDVPSEGLPLSAARNRGAREAMALGAEVLVFLDVDCLAGPDLVVGYEGAVVRSPGTVWSGPVTYLPPGLSESQLAQPWPLDDPHPARPAPPPGVLLDAAEPDLFWSLSFALHRGAWSTSGGFCEDYVGYGGEDTDFAQQAADRGLGFGWVGDARAYHQFHVTHSPPTQHLDDILRNATLFHRRWGRWPMRGWFEEFERLGLVVRTDQGWDRVRRDDSAEQQRPRLA
jgi:N-acetylglucosaminyl-diphospho-decaprenol L-rhamnosyltransferase